jgi:hypothetical protein
VRGEQIAPRATRVIAIAGERKCRTRVHEREAEAPGQRYRLSPPLRVAISFLACAATADGTPLLFARLLRSLS